MKKMNKDQVAKYLESLMLSVESGEIVGVTVVTSDKNGVVRMDVLGYPNQNQE